MNVVLFRKVHSLRILNKFANKWWPYFLYSSPHTYGSLLFIKDLCKKKKKKFKSPLVWSHDREAAASPYLGALNNRAEFAWHRPPAFIASLLELPPILESSWSLTQRSHRTRSRKRHLHRSLLQTVCDIGVRRGKQHLILTSTLRYKQTKNRDNWLGELERKPHQSTTWKPWYNI